MTLDSPKKIKSEYCKREAEPHRFVHHEAGWVIFRIRSEEDSENAKELIRLAYDNADRLIAAHMSRMDPQATK